MYGKEEEFKRHVPAEAGEVSHEEFKNMLEETEEHPEEEPEEGQRCISEPQEIMHLLAERYSVKFILQFRLLNEKMIF